MTNVECILSNFTDEELCSIYSNLNCWRWDERLGPKPEKWDRLPDFRSGLFGNLFPDKYKILHPYLRYIKKKVGEKELLRYHNTRSLRGHHWTNEQFEEWYAKYHSEK